MLATIWKYPSFENSLSMFHFPEMHSASDDETSPNSSSIGDCASLRDAGVRLSDLVVHGPVWHIYCAYEFYD